MVVRPLYDHFGYRGALLVPILGAVAAVFVARALAQRIGASGWLAFAIVGVGSPVLIYGLDLWEHALGVAAMAWAVVMACDVRMMRRRPAWGLAVGLLFGVAATMRTEALLYGAWCVVAFGLLLWRSQRRWRPPFVFGVTALVGVIAPLVANAVLEHIVLGGALRATRAIGTAEGSGSDLSVRLREAVTTTIGVRGLSNLREEALLGLLFIGSLVCTVWCASSAKRRAFAPKAAVLSVALFALLCTLGWGFVPGLLVASPMAAIGLTMVKRPGMTCELVLIAFGPTAAGVGGAVHRRCRATVGRPLRTALGFRSLRGGCGRSVRAAPLAEGVGRGDGDQHDRLRRQLDGRAYAHRRSGDGRRRGLARADGHLDVVASVP